MPGERRAESERSYVAPLEPDGTLAGKPQPRGDIQRDRNGLNYICKSQPIRS